MRVASSARTVCIVQFSESGCGAFVEKEYASTYPSGFCTSTTPPCQPMIAPGYTGSNALRVSLAARETFWLINRRTSVGLSTNPQEPEQMTFLNPPVFY